MSLGLCGQAELDEQVRKSSARRAKMEKERGPEDDALTPSFEPAEEQPERKDEITLETLFGETKKD